MLFEKEKIMKSKNLAQVLRAASKGTTLLVVALLSFQIVDAKTKKQPSKPASKNVVRKSPPAQRFAPVAARNNQPAMPAAVVKEEETFVEKVSEQPLIPSQNIGQSVDLNTEQLEDGGIKITETTVQPMPEEGKIVTTVNEWTMYDYAKAAAIGTAIIGAGGLAYIYRDELAKQGRNGYNTANDWYNGLKNQKVAEDTKPITQQTANAKVEEDIAGAGKDSGLVEANEIVEGTAPKLREAMANASQKFVESLQETAKDPNVIYDADEIIDNGTPQEFRTAIADASKAVGAYVKESAQNVSRVAQGTAKVLKNGVSDASQSAWEKMKSFLPQSQEAPVINNPVETSANPAQVVARSAVDAQVVAEANQPMQSGSVSMVVPPMTANQQKDALIKQVESDKTLTNPEKDIIANAIKNTPENTDNGNGTASE